MGNILVFDIGGTAVKAAMMDEERNILQREEEKTPQTGQKELLALIHDIYKKYESQAEGISISMPGIIDSEKGYVHTGGALTYNNDSEFRKLAEEICGTRVLIENDAKCALAAEMWCGSLSDVQDGITLILGTGVGGGIMIGRRLVKGTHFSAGEVSFSCLNYNRFGEDDAMTGSCCSTRGLVNLAKEALALEELDGRRLFAMLEEGNEKLEQVLKDYCYSLAVLVFNLQVTLDVQRVSFGGGISRQPRLLECIREQTDRVFDHESLKRFTPGLPKPEIVACSYFNDSNLIGALYHYISRQS